MASRRRAVARPADPGPSRPLDRYQAKRDFKRTTEPAGTVGLSSGGRFVVQKHAARRLHYDLRLELDGVFKSWAVTRGPSLDPKDKRLAVHVEDHPLEYGDFEGAIPKGEYGGGTVMVWDAGRWSPEGDARADYAAGRIKFTLEGRKLQGRWMLVRMSGRDGRQDPWLLVKERDDHALLGGSALADDDVSVRSGRTMAQIAEGVREAGPPRFVAPQLATPGAEPPAGPGWVYELKHDGYRCQVRVDLGGATVRTRGSHDWTDRFPAIARAARELPARSALIDGEAAVPGERGETSFALLRQALEAGGTDIVFYAFDLLFLDGVDLRGRALLDRKARLQALLPVHGVIRYSEHVEADGPELLRNACRLGAEGLIAKRSDRPYRSGRGNDWLKLKCERRQEVVIGGYTPVRGRQGGLGALVVGSYEDDALNYAGRVGTGWSAEDEARILGALEALRRDRMPFVQVPPAMQRGVRWVEPRVVAEVQFQDWTPDGRLRHARWLGTREDKDARAVVREPVTVMAPPKAVGTVRLTHPARVMLREPPTTKADVWRYYLTVADHALPGIVGRPLSVIRCPSGAEGDCFFQRHLMAGMPKAVRAVVSDGGHGPGEYFAVEDLEGLLALVQFGAVEFHPWGSRADRVDRPDRLVFDFDPADGIGWERVIEAAQEMKQRLAAQGLESFARTTGGKGVHVVVPIERRYGWLAVKRFAAGVAREMAADSPQRYTAKLAKAARRGRIFIDYLRNERGATAVASYSIRARAGARIAMPVAWDEVTHALDPARFTVGTVPGRVVEREDPWRALGGLRQRLPRSTAGR